MTENHSPCMDYLPRDSVVHPTSYVSNQAIFDGRGFSRKTSAGYSHGTWWINPSTPANPLQAGFFVLGQSGQAISSGSEALSDCFCLHIAEPFHDMTLQLHLAVVILKQKPVAMDKRAPRASSIVGWFSRLPWPGYIGDSVVPPSCHRALVAARAPLAVSGEDAQSDNRLATTQGGPEAARLVGKSPRFGGPEPLVRDESSDSPVQ